MACLLGVFVLLTGCGGSTTLQYGAEKLQRVDDCLTHAGFDTNPIQSFIPSTSDNADAIEAFGRVGPNQQVTKSLVLITMAGPRQIQVPPPGASKTGVAQIDGVAIKPLLYRAGTPYLRPVGTMPNGTRIVACARA
jgi:hypothetical protein